MNILVCDDDHAIVDAIEIYLSQEGYRVLKAYDGLEAIKMLQEHEIHLILIDIMMPKMMECGHLRFLGSISERMIILPSRSIRWN